MPVVRTRFSAATVLSTLLALLTLFYAGVRGGPADIIIALLVLILSAIVDLTSCARPADTRKKRSNNPSRFIPCT